MKFSGLLGAMVLVAASLPFGVASAADHNPAMPAIDCATANATMAKMTSPDMMKPAPVDAGADLDKNFAVQMHAMTEHGMQMAKLEAKCGKDAKTRAAAQQMVGHLQEYTNTFAMLLQNQPAGTY